MSPRAARCLAALSLSVLATVGCQIEVRESATGTWTTIPPGSTLTLNRAVTIPQDRARVFFRNGQLRPVGANQGPSCGLEVATLSRGGSQTVAAGTYRIARVQNYWTQVAWGGPAAAPRLIPASGTDGGGTPMIQEGYHLWLEGGPDPNVRRLTCLGMLDDMWRARPPTLEEIRTALGSLADLELTPGT